MKGYNTNLASEFFVLSQLHRKGFDASLTLGNKKSVDIIIFNKDGQLVTIDVKGMIGTTLFPLDNIDINDNNSFHYLVFVSYNNDFYNERSLPLTYIVPISDIHDLIYINPKGNRKGVNLSTLKKFKNHYENNWEIIRSYGAGYTKTDKYDKGKWIEFLVIYNGLKEDFLPYNYFAKTIFFLDFIKLWIDNKNNYPIDIQKVINDYCKYIDINGINRLKNSISNNNDNQDIYNIISQTLDENFSEKQKNGEVELTKDNSIIKWKEPIPQAIIDSISQEGKYLKKNKNDIKDKLIHGA